MIRRMMMMMMMMVGVMSLMHAMMHVIMYVRNMTMDAMMRVMMVMMSMMVGKPVTTSAMTLTESLWLRRAALTHQRSLLGLSNLSNFSNSLSNLLRLNSLSLGDEEEDEERVANEDTAPQPAELADRQQRTRRPPVRRQKCRLVQRQEDGVATGKRGKKRDARWMPRVCPTVLQVLCQPLFFLESIVSAQPSTAMSCVAARR